MDSLIGKKFTVKVTDKHIRDGMPKVSTICPIALGVDCTFSKVFAYENIVSVCNEIFVNFKTGNSDNTFHFKYADDNISYWLKEFDALNHVDPIDIELHIMHGVEGIDNDGKYKRCFNGDARITWKGW